MLAWNPRHANRVYERENFAYPMDAQSKVNLSMKEPKRFA